MKKLILTIVMTALSGYCGKVQIEFLDITADRSVTVTGSQSNDIAEAKSHVAALAAYTAYWPRDATASSWFMFTANANEITITGYDIGGGTDVVIPDYINGLPVTKIGEYSFNGSSVTSINGAGNVVSVEESAFSDCSSLTSVNLPQAHTIGDSVFYDCNALTSVNLPLAHTIGDNAFYYCNALTSVYFDNDAPLIGVDIFNNIPANQVTNYVTNAQATGWGDTLGGMPVVRLPLYADAIYQAGQPVATEAHVAQAIAAIPEPDLSGRVAVDGGTATNLTTHGWLALPQTQATNLTYRLVTSNDVILAIGVWE